MIGHLWELEHAGFFFARDGGKIWRNPMNEPKSTMARQIAQAAIAFEQMRTGNQVPKSLSVVLSEGTLVITLYDALSPAEKVLAMSPEGAAQMQEFRASYLITLQPHWDKNRNHWAESGKFANRAGNGQCG